MDKWTEKYIDLTANVEKPIPIDVPCNAIAIRNLDASNIIYAGLDHVTTALYDAVAMPGGWGSISAAKDIKQLHLISTGDMSAVKLFLIQADNPSAYMSQMMRAPSGQTSVISTVGLKASELNIDSDENIGIFERGFTWKKVNADAAGDVTVKASAGQVLVLAADASETIHLVDGAVQAWKTGAFSFSQPVNCSTSIKVNFGAAGNAWILYR